MAIISTGSFAKALQPGVNKWVGGAYSQVEHHYKAMMQIEKSLKNFEEDVTFRGPGVLVKKPESSNVTYDDMAQGFVTRYVHVVYELGLICTREAIEDNLYQNLMPKKSEKLGRSARTTKEIVCANVYNRAFSSSYPGGNGLEMCSAVQLAENGATYRNELAVAADLSEAALEQACIDIRTQLIDGSGQLIGAQPRKLVLPAELVFDAKRILDSDLQNDTANNATNALKGMNMMPEGMVANPYLTDSDAWFVLTSESDGPKLFERRALEVANDTDFDSSNVKYKVSERYSAGFTDPRAIFGSPGAA